MTGVDLHLPPGFRFHPTDEELVMHYLCRKCASQPIVVPIIAEIDLYKFNPWNLPDLALYGEKEWYFFTPRDRKYPNGSRPNRAAGTGYWKATGADKPIGSPKPVGIKKALVFYTGKAPKGEKSNWIMHEYRLADVDRSAANKKNNSLRLDDWVLCRIYNKKGSTQKNQVMSSNTNMSSIEEDKKPDILPPRPSSSMHLLRLGQPDSVPKLYSDSNCSGAQVVSPEFTCEREVQSEQKPTNWEKTTIDFPFQYLDTGSGIPTADQFQSSYQMSSLPDAFMYLQKPF